MDSILQNIFSYWVSNFVRESEISETRSRPLFSTCRMENGTCSRAKKALALDRSAPVVKLRACTQNEQHS